MEKRTGEICLKSFGWVAGVPPIRFVESRGESAVSRMAVAWLLTCRRLNDGVIRIAAVSNTSSSHHQPFLYTSVSHAVMMDGHAVCLGEGDGEGQKVI